MFATKRILLAASILLVALQCAAQTPAAVSVSDELRAMADEDQRMRQAGDTDPQAEYDADKRHRLRVLELLAEGRILLGEDKVRAALLLQHTGAVLCDGALRSESLENYLLAHFLARSAARAGHRPARRMAALTIDRYLVFSGRPQKYGTQYRFDEKAGREVLLEVDPATTDAERAEWDVEPLAVLRGEGRDDATP